MGSLRRLQAIWRWLEGDKGQDLLEYGLLTALIALAALGAVSQVGTVLTTVFWDWIAAATGSL